jgi:hypothetical protein
VRIDVVPRVATNETHRRPSKIPVFSLKGLFQRYLPKADINCRDCDGRSLTEPEPDRHVFAKFKHLLRKAAARSAETICVTIGILRALTPTECANYVRNSGYAQS